MGITLLRRFSLIKCIKHSKNYEGEICNPQNK